MVDKIAGGQIVPNIKDTAPILHVVTHKQQSAIDAVGQVA
jgi:hypothetical protein